MNGCDESFEREWKQEREEWRNQKDHEAPVIHALDRALNSPGRFRMRLIRWLFPEIVEVATALRDYYWK